MSPRFIKFKVIRSFTESLAHSPLIMDRTEVIAHLPRYWSSQENSERSTICTGGWGVLQCGYRRLERVKGKHVERGARLWIVSPRVLFCEAGADEKLDCAFNPLTVPFTRVFFSFQITNWTEESPPPPPPPPPRRDSRGKEERYLMIHHCVWTLISIKDLFVFPWI